MIKTLIFDFGDVFLNLDKAGALKNALEHFKMDALSEELVAINTLYEQGLLSTEEFIEFYQDNFSNLTEKDIIDAWNYILRDFPEERLNFIVQGYGGFEVQLLIDATIRIQKRLGGLETKNAVQFFNENNIIAAFAILLKYYDRWYEKNTLSASPPKLLVQQFNAKKVDPLNNAILVEKR